MLLAGTSIGVYRVPERGFETADPVLEDRSVRELHARDGRVFAATESGLLATSDGGDTWTDLDVPKGDVHSVHCSDGRVYAGVRPAAIYHAPVGERNWQPLDGFGAFASDAAWPTNPRHDDASVRSIASPDDRPDVLLAGVEVGGFVASTDGGASWRGVDAVPDDVHDVVTVGPDRWVVSCGVGGPDGRGGVFETSDGGDTWTERDVGPYEYVRESCYDGRLYTAGNRDAPLWTPPDAALFVETDGTLEDVPYPGAPESYVISWATSGENVLAGANDGSILRGADGWERLGAVPIPEEDRRAWGVRSLAVVGE